MAFCCSFCRGAVQTQLRLKHLREGAGALRCPCRRRRGGRGEEEGRWGKEEIGGRSADRSTDRGSPSVRKKTEGQCGKPPGARLRLDAPAACQKRDNRRKISLYVFFSVFFFFRGSLRSEILSNRERDIGCGGVRRRTPESPERNVTRRSAALRNLSRILRGDQTE